jgi:hypothetical protein
MVAIAVSTAETAVVRTRGAVLTFVTSSVPTPGFHLLGLVDVPQIWHVGDISDIGDIQYIPQVLDIRNILDIRNVRRDIGSPRIVHQVNGIQPPVAFRPVP